MNPPTKIYVAGHRGMVGSAIVRQLQAPGLPRFARNDGDSRHCEERSDAAIHDPNTLGLPRYARNDGDFRHCEERSDAAIHDPDTPGLPRYAFHEHLVIANAVKQSMTSNSLDGRASLAVTGSWFMVRVRYLAGYGRLAMTGILVIARSVATRQSMTPIPLDCRATLAMTTWLSLRAKRSNPCTRPP